MKILVTGGCGFIGSNFVLKTVTNDKIEVLNFDKLTYAGNSKTLHSIVKNINYSFIHGDICDINLLIETINQFKPDTIIHLAAESHVDRSIENPMDFIKTNIVGTSILLEASTKYWENQNKTNFRFLHVSTDEVYGSLGEQGFFSEKSKYNPTSPYSASKASSDHLVRAWHKTYGLPILITNCSNNYGPYQFPEKLIPLMIANCLDEKQLPIYGDGENIRDWLFVDDHCDAISNVLNKGVIGETYNIGGNNAIRNIDIVNLICSELDIKKPRKTGKSYKDLITYVKDRPGHDFRYAIDASKIKEDLDWKPKQTFESGIDKTINWYIENESWWRNIQKRNYNQERLDIKK